MKNLNLLKKFTATLLIATLLISFIPTQKAEAQWVDFSVMAKEYGLDTIVSIMVKSMIKRVTASTVNWINSGFQGNPAYVSNPDQFFGNIAEGVAGQYIYNNPNLRFMCTGFNLKVQAAITRAYQQPLGTFQCSLDKVIKNYDNFIGDFDQGGWDGFIQVTQNPQNNPIGLYTSWQDDYTRRAQNEVQKSQNELNQGNGFLSFKSCPGGRFTQAQIDALNEEGSNGSGMIATYKVGDCIGKEKIETPGSVISNKLNKALGTDEDSLVTADEISELVGALIGQLTNKVLTLGLGALSRIGSGGNGNSSFTGTLIDDPKTGATALEKQANDMDIAAQNASYPCIVPGTNQPGFATTPTGTCTPSGTAGTGGGGAGGVGGGSTGGTGGGTGNGGAGGDLLYVCNLPGGGQGIQVGTTGACQPGGTGAGFIPIVATDGSTITGMPLDPQCSTISFDNIVARATTLHAGNPALGTIANIVQNMQCPGGVLP